MTTLLMEVNGEEGAEGVFVVNQEDGQFETLDQLNTDNEAVTAVASVGDGQDLVTSVGEGQDLVSMAMESSNVMQPEVVEQQQQQQAVTAVVDDEYPDEIECQLIQKSVYINGQMQQIDFIMCNQCPRLFRTENLLWQHIKGKHKRRPGYRTYQPVKRSMMRLDDDGFDDDDDDDDTVPANNQVLEPGEINIPAKEVRRNVVKTPNRKDLFVVGLDKSRSRGSTVKRMYADSSHGPFKCPGCDNVSFNNRRNLELHMKRLHKAGIAECDECGRKVLDLKRHKEILHKRFKIYDCPHCTDKFCTQEDMERHLQKIEKNNEVTINREKIHPEEIVESKPDKDKVNDSQTDEEAEASKENQEKPSEADLGKIFRCSECGMKTPSRMTYIQHVLTGCIMDMNEGDSSVKISVNGEVEKKPKRGRPKGSTNKPKPPKIMKLDDEDEA